MINGVLAGNDEMKQDWCRIGNTAGEEETW